MHRGIMPMGERVPRAGSVRAKYANERTNESGKRSERKRAFAVFVLSFSRSLPFGRSSLLKGERLVGGGQETHLTATAATAGRASNQCAAS